MQDLPHNYRVAANADATSNVVVSSDGLASLDTAPPAEFGGPGDLWSPETLLVAAVANCFILTFRAIARASKLEWVSLGCDVSAKLEKIDRVTQFTEYNVSAVVAVPPGTNEKKALRLLEKAEAKCLVTNSLTGTSHLEAEVRIADATPLTTS